MVFTRRVKRSTERIPIMTKNYILVGANPAEMLKTQHRGGVLSLSIGLLDYAEKKGYCIEIIDTFFDTFALKGHSYLSLIKRIPRGFSRIIQLIKMLFSFKYSGVIIFSGSGFSFYERIFLSAICSLFRIPVVFFIVSGNFFDILKAKAAKKKWVGFLLSIPNYIAVSGAQWFKLLEGLNVRSKKIVLIHYWLKSSFPIAHKPKKKAADEMVHFVFVGWIIKEKGIYEIIYAIEKLIEKYQFRFTFIGSGTLLNDLRNEISKSNWGNSVSALGWVTDDESSKIIASGDVFVLPSYAEGFPISLIEALSLGLPAICTNVGGISDSLQSGVNGYLIPPRQVEPLIEAMEHYLQDPSLIDKHSKAALQIFSENHSQDENCKLIFQALEKG